MLLFLLACQHGQDSGKLDTGSVDSGDTHDSDTGDTGETGETGDSDFPHDSADNLCGVIHPTQDCTAAPTGAPVWTIQDGLTGCSGSDTGGGPDWHGTLVATLPVTDWRFEGKLDPGSYAVELDAGGCYGCRVVDVTDATCTPVDLSFSPHDIADEPIVYLYPPERTPVVVEVADPDTLTAVDPEYPAQGWHVVAEPDGRLHTAEGDRDYLFYERTVDHWPFQTTAGWCAEGPTAEASVLDAMAQLGFSDTERADFAAYWDLNFPHARGTIYPQLDRLPALDVSPAPDAVLRAWFYVVPGCRTQTMPELPTFTRHGFVATEWGVVLAPPLRQP